MLTVVFVSRCTGKALAQTRRVLDAYAQRAGDTTWFASITAEGLDALQGALKHAASRLTAVACHQMTRKGAELRWIVGRRRAFSDSGAVPVRTRKSGHDALARRVPFQGLPKLLSVCVHAGLHHDTGKGTLLFKDKLRHNEKFADPVRHEWLSVHINRALREGKNYKSALLLAAEQVLTQTIHSPFLSLPVTEAQLGEWLVATHHRLPDENAVGKPICQQHINPAADDKQRNKLRKLPAGADLFADPAVASALSAAALSDEALSPPLRDALFLWGRLAMMLSDHHVSSGKDPLPGPSGLLANGRQDLGAHLLAIGSKSKHAARLLSRLDAKLPAVYPEERRILEASAPKAYAWQNEAARAAKTLAEKEDAHVCGTFVVLCASTGSGKTRAGARLASILAGARLRLSTLLGLRTLTLQTGAAYRQELGLSPVQVATLIGSHEIRALHAADVRNGERAPNDDDDEGFDLQSLVDSETVQELPALIDTQIRRRDDRQLLSAPVLVSTIDYLIQAGDWRRAWHLVPQLRLLTSDVLLDEIDGYDLADYPAIGRLCYLVGLFGRRLILSSATAMPEMVTPLYHAYTEGRTAYAQLTGAKAAVQTLFAADHAAPEVGRPASVEMFSKLYADFTHKVGKAALKSKILRRGRCAVIENVPQLISVAKTLHADNAIQFGAQQVSAGFIRFAHVRDAVQVANRIALQVERLEKDGYKVVVMPYHAMLPLAVRAHTEQCLDRWLKRKFAPSTGEQDPLLSADPVQAALREGHRNVVLLVVATPVEEVGRDHDFDWAIIEPSSSRSIAQCAGRVNRHRRQEIVEGRINVVVMRYNLRRLARNGGSGAVFTRPGFECAKRPFSVSKDIPEGLDVYDMSVSAGALVARPDAAACLLSLDVLKDRGDLLALLERKEIEKQLKDKLVGAFLNKPLRKYTTQHFKEYRFRSSAPATAVYFNPETELWYKVPDQAGTQGAGTAQQFPVHRWPEGKTGFWLQPEEFPHIVRKIAQQANCSPDQETFYAKYLMVSLANSYMEKPHALAADPLIGIYQQDLSVLLDPSLQDSLN